MEKEKILFEILRTGFIPIVIKDKLPFSQCIEAVAGANIGAIEISCRHPEALNLIRQAKKHFPDMAIGAASLIEHGKLFDSINNSGHFLPSIDQAVDAGADFLVSLLPFREETYTKYSCTHVIIPGVSTPGEAHVSIDMGANLLKFINPRLSGGPAFFKGMDPATHRSLPFFVTGGMTAEIIPEYIEANVMVFGAGFDLVLGAQYQQMQAEFRPHILREKLNNYLKAIKSARLKYQPRIPFESADVFEIISKSGRCFNVV